MAVPVSRREYANVPAVLQDTVVKSVGPLRELYQFKSRIFTNTVFFFKGNPLMTTFYFSIINKK